MVRSICVINGHPHPDRGHFCHALAEAYACDDAQGRFVTDFVDAWTKVMNLDRFDLL